MRVYCIYKNQVKTLKPIYGKNNKTRNVWCILHLRKFDREACDILQSAKYGRKKCHNLVWA